MNSTNFIKHYDNLVAGWLNGKYSNDPFLKTQKPGQGLLTPDYIATMPEPYYGNINDNLVTIVNLNPGYNDSPGNKPDCEVLSVCNMLKLFRGGDYHGYAQNFPVLQQNPYHARCAKWWLDRIGKLVRLSGMSLPKGLVYGQTSCISSDWLPFALDLCPWHSRRWKEIGLSIQDMLDDVGLQRLINQWFINPLVHGISHSKFGIGLAIGCPNIEMLKSVGFQAEMEWSGSNTHGLKWPRSNSGKNTVRRFVYLKLSKSPEDDEERWKNITGECVKVLGMTANQMKLPRDEFYGPDSVLSQIINYIKNN